MVPKLCCKKNILTKALLILIFSMAVWAQDSSRGASVQIISAHKTEYRKDSETGNEVIYFTGEVSLSVSQGGDEILIEADSVTFNRAECLLYAEGNVAFGIKGSGSTEKMTASSLLFNTETQEGLFDDGRVVQGSDSSAINLSGDQKLIINSDLFSKSSTGVVTFKDGTLTFCDEETPHWKIEASRIWLLPGNEFAFLNAAFYVGRIPVMYFPFFYYPKDEMIFNPVIGYDARKGYSIQTTTYLIGRKGLSSSSSGSETAELTNFLKSKELKEQVQEGLFLRNLDARATVPQEYLKVIGDGYSNLGFMAGLEGSFKPTGIITDFSFSLFSAFSNTVFPAGTNSYTTWYDNETYYDHSMFLGVDFPFRFGGNVKLNLKQDIFSLSLDMPIYSDPYFKSDFLSSRSEDMEWLDFLMNNPALKSDDSSTSTSSTTDFSWKISGTVAKPKFLDQYDPYLKTFSLSASVEVHFATMTNPNVSYPLSSYSPLRSIYYPSQMKPLEISLDIAGTLLQSSEASSTRNSGTKDLYFKPDVLSDDAAGAGKESLSEGEENEVEFIPEALPDYMTKSMGSLSLKKNSVTPLSYSLTYTFKPSLKVENNYNTVDFKNYSNFFGSGTGTSLFQLKGPVKLSGKSQWNGTVFSFNDDLSLNPQYQTHLKVSEASYPEGSSSLSQLRLSDYKSSSVDVSNSSSISFKPFMNFSNLADSQISWNGAIKMLRSSFVGTADDPDWEIKLPGWDTDSITSNSLKFSLVSRMFNSTHSGTMNLDINLPPLLGSITASLSMSFPYCDSFYLSTGVKQVSKTDDEWIYQSLSESSSWKFLDKTLSISQSLVYDLENGQMTSAVLKAGWKNLDLSFSMGYSYPYELKAGTGWTAGSSKVFQAENMNIKYSYSTDTFYSWKDRISVKASVSTQLYMNMVKETESYFTFTPSVTLKINELLDLTFSSSSRNASVFKYVQNLSDMDVEVPGEKNIFVDLFDSFAFWNDELRKKSAFKLNSLSIKITHDLHDWSVNSEFSISPRLIKTSRPYYYDFSPYFKLSVVWKPLSTLKTTIVDEYGTFQLNP